MQDPQLGRYKAFLFVGIAYFLTAVLAPLVTLMLRGADWNYPRSGMGWSLLAGIVVGVPWPIFGTMLGGWILLASGLGKRSKEQPDEGQTK
jgi:predicted branched-subunit amino acid permease